MSNRKYRAAQRTLAVMHVNKTWAQMARDTGISATTIKKFATGDVNSPHFDTVDRLCEYAGYAVEINKQVYNVIKKQEEATIDAYNSGRA